MSTRAETIEALKGLAQEQVKGLDYLASLPDDLSPTPAVDEARVANVIRHLYGPMSQDQWDAIHAALVGAPEPAPTPTGISQIGLTPDDFHRATTALQCTYAQLRAVDEVESGGGWFTDMRADILALDGPGGFLDGPNLPKILFEALWFHKFTHGAYDESHPNISSPKWDRKLYVGGQAEYKRLEEAIKLDEEAALKSASVGRYQIMGFNFDKAGFTDVHKFWDAMKTSEVLQLEAFVTFIGKSGLGDELRAISDDPKTCRAFAGAYNGSGQVDAYAGKIAAAHKKYRLQG